MHVPALRYLSQATGWVWGAPRGAGLAPVGGARERTQLAPTCIAVRHGTGSEVPPGACGAEGCSDWVTLSRATWRRWRQETCAGLAPSTQTRERTLRPPARAPPRHERARRRERHCTRSACAACSIAPLSSRSRAANLDVKRALPHSVMVVERRAAGHPLLAPWSQQEGHPVATEVRFEQWCTTG